MRPRFTMRPLWAVSTRFFAERMQKMSPTTSPGMACVGPFPIRKDDLRQRGSGLSMLHLWRCQARMLLQGGTAPTGSPERQTEIESAVKTAVRAAMAVHRNKKGRGKGEGAGNRKVTSTGSVSSSPRVGVSCFLSCWNWDPRGGLATQLRAAFHSQRRSARWIPPRS